MLRSVPPHPPKTVDHVDLPRYLGKWFEIAVIPYFWETGCEYTTAEYSMNKDNKSVRVSNKCIRYGKESENVGKATPEDDSFSKFKLQFIQTLDIAGGYWIVRLGSNYEYSVVSSPDYKYLWVLSRTPTMDNSVYDSIIESLKKDEFPV